VTSPGPALTDHAVIGYVHGGTVRAEFCASLISIAMEGATPLDAVLTYASGPNISTARNKVVREFLDCQRAPWLFMVDTDMVLEPDSIDRLIAAADPAERPVLGMLAFSQNAAGEPFSTMYELTRKGSGELAFTRYGTWPEDTCVQVSATGAACLLMHRTALETVEKHAMDVAAPWFRETSVGPLALMGEDLTFCLRCAAAGIPVHVHTGVKAGHMKTAMI
jgi:GT2 family glycosyltransferase